jgi:chondroitin sulfate N-acetylgalactosaminyltransferase 1/2
MGVTLLARMLLLISSVTLISLLALTRCGLSGAALDNGISMEEGSLPSPKNHSERKEKNQLI